MDKEEAMKKKKKEMEDAVTEFDNYWTCLRENQDQIEKLAMENDYCGIQKIFVKCKVPKQYWKGLMEVVIKCPDMQPWQ